MANMHNYNFAKKKKTDQKVQSYGEKKAWKLNLKTFLIWLEKISKFPSVQTSTFCRKGGGPDKIKEE